MSERNLIYFCSGTFQAFRAEPLLILLPIHLFPQNINVEGAKSFSLLACIAPRQGNLRE